ncbi:MAG: phosphotransferase [Myxococcales bacterium]|nr:phosphotransferase [Myxococcales bacterium]MCB9714400.1 phosphotransferase [Myxococcales bacterium]
MPAPWTAERVVSPAEALALVAAAHPSLSASRIEALGEGWDNTAYLVDDTWVFRFPRRQIAVELIEIESRVLPAIAGRLPLPIPVPELLGEPSESFPWPFSGYRRLHGRTADRAALDPTRKAALAEPLAEFLAALHAVDGRATGAPVDTLARTNTERVVPVVRSGLEAAVAAGLIDDLRPYEPLLAQVHGPLPPRAVLVHADLYVRHVLVDDASRACGVIDWGDVHLGHPGLDLALAFSLLPPSARSRFARAYGPIDDESWALGRQRGLLYGAVLCAYGLDIGDSALVAEGQQALRWVLE